MTPPHYAMRSHIQQCRSIMRDHAMIWRKLCEDRLDSIAFIALRRAILWLSQLRGKPILKLTDDDYNEAGLQDLIHLHGSAYETNLIGFYELQHTITGWPGGRDPKKSKPGDAPVRLQLQRRADSSDGCVRRLQSHHHGPGLSSQAVRRAQPDLLRVRVSGPPRQRLPD